MGILDLLSGGLGGKIADIVGKHVQDKDLAAKLEQDLAIATLESQTTLAKAQADTNIAEAQSGSLFRGGWRPAVGWVCVFALGYQMVLRPLITWGAQNWLAMPPPSLELDTLLTLLFGMLGLGAMRTAEKFKGVAS